MKSILASRLRKEAHGRLSAYDRRCTPAGARGRRQGQVPRKASPANKAGRRAAARSDVIFAPSILMDVMIERRWAQQKEARLRHE